MDGSVVGRVVHPRSDGDVLQRSKSGWWSVAGTVSTKGLGWIRVNVWCSRLCIRDTKTGDFS